VRVWGGGGIGMMRLLRVRCTFIPYNIYIVSMCNIHIYIICTAASGPQPEGCGRLVGVKRHLLLPSYNNNTTAPRDDNLIYFNMPYAYNIVLLNGIYMT